MSNQLHDIPGLHQLQVSIPAAAAADATAVLAYTRMPFKCKVKSVLAVHSAAITGAADHTQNHNISKVVAGTPTEIANKDYGAGVTASAGVPVTIGSDLDVELNEGDLLSFTREKVGNGTALGASTLIVTIVGN